MSQPHVICVVLNSNHREDTQACLLSLQNNTYQKHSTIVLDNSSIDGSVQAIRSAFPEADIIELTENLGYAGNNNVGIENALRQGADWVFILNEDTILDPQCIEQLVLVAENEPTIGIVGPMVYHFDEPNVIQSAGGKMDEHFLGWHLGQNELDKGQFTQPHSVDWISGCGIMIRREVIEQVGMIDERFFYYIEEFDWCLRAKEAGWKIIHVPQAKLWHKGVQRDYRPKPYVTYFATRNRLLLLSKHRAPLAAWIVAWGHFFRTLASWTLKPKWRSMHEHRNVMWRGIIDFMLQRWGPMS